MNNFEQEIKAFFQLLNEHQVKYLLVGGLAVNSYGYARSTGDVDLWLKDSSPNRKKLVKALQAYDIQGADIFLDHPLIAGYSEIQLTSGIYLDLMADLQHINQEEFDKCFQKAFNFELSDEITVKVIPLETLLEEKSKSERPKDQEDVRQLRQLQDDNTESRN